MREMLERYAELLITKGVEFAPRVLLALFTLVIGLWLVNRLTRIMKESFHVRRVNRTLVTFFESLVSISLKILVFISVAMMVGIQMTSFIAVLGAASLALGLSLQGSLANLAGGILILFFRPFEIGDDVMILGQRGTVQNIEIFYTILKGEEDVTIILPNGAVSNGVILNYTRKQSGQMRY